MGKQLHKRRRLVLLTAGLAVLLVLVLYAFLGVFPFGGSTVLTGDLNSQYIPYFAHYKRAVAGGNPAFGTVYGFDKALGGGLLGLFAYYVSSPFNLLYLLVPVSAFPHVAALIFLCKTVLACCFFALFLSRKLPALGLPCVALSLGYGFMAYTVLYAQNIMWHDVVLLLPLVLLGIDKILEGGSLLPYVGALALSIYANFYIAYAVCIFAVLYFVYSAYTEGVRGFKRPTLRFLAASLLAGGLNAALLVPSLLNVSSTKGSLFSFTFSLEAQFPLRQLAEGFVLGSTGSADAQAGGPFLYCSLLALLLVGCYFASGKISRGHRLAGAALLLALLVSMRVKGLDTLWHGMAQPVWFPYRYTFLACAVLLLLAAKALAEGAVAPKSLLITGALFAAVGLYLFIVPGALFRRSILLTGLVGVVLAGLLLLYSRGGRRGLLSAGLIAVTMAELGYHAFTIWDGFEKYPLAAYQSFVADGGETLAEIEALDAGQYRVEKNFYRTLNDAMLLGYNGIGHFGSTQDEAAVATLMRLGWRSFGGANGYLYGSTAFADAVLGIRYVYSDGTRPVAAHLTRVETDGAHEVYENPYVLPLLFAARGDLAAPLERDSSFAYQNALYAAISGEAEALLRPAVVDATAASGAAIASTGSMPEGFRYSVTAGVAGYYYILPQAAGGRLYNLGLTINGEDAGWYFAAEHSGIINLGYLQAGETATLAFDYRKDILNPETPDSIAIESVEAAYIRPAQLEALAQEAAAGTTIHSFAGGYVHATVRAETDTLLFTSIPYESGWKAFVNDERVEAVEAAGGLLALPLTAGENSVVLRYEVRGRMVGSGVTLVCLLALVALQIFSLLPVGRKKREEP